MTNPLVSICCTAYNHAPYIGQALDGFLAQVTNFPIEILVHDDASTDGTADIIREYEARHPHLIKPIYQTVNQYSQGKKTSRLNYNRARGKYIALCEGDDYWIDPHKLARQVDYLESHPEVFICGHAVRQVDQCGHTIAESKFDIYAEAYLTPEDMAFGKLGFPTLSVVFRNTHPIPSFKIINSDTLTFASFSNLGAGYIFKEVMGVYRIHPGGIWSSRSERAKIDMLTETLSLIPSVIAPERRALAYANMLRHALVKDTVTPRRMKNALVSGAMTLRWLNRNTARYLAYEGLQVVRKRHAKGSGKASRVTAVSETSGQPVKAAP